jgi:Na+/H+ antiporter NhaD/arsenite permease-like protein
VSALIFTARQSYYPAIKIPNIMSKAIKTLFIWTGVVLSVFAIGYLFLPSVGMAVALSGLTAAVLGTILYGEERMPLVVGGLVLLLAGGVTDFHHLIEGMEWVLFIKLVGLLTWVDFLNHTGYFDHLIEKYLPRKFQGFPLIALLLVLGSLSAALIDEVNSIVLWYAVIRAIIGFTKKGIFKLKKASWMVMVILLVSATNIGSQFLPLGNPVGIAISVISGLNALDFMKYAWVPGLLTLAYFLVRVRFGYSGLINEFKTVAVEAEDFEVLEEMHDQYEVVETSDPVGTQSSHAIEKKEVPMHILHWLFGGGLVGLIFASPFSAFLGFNPSDGLGIFVLLLFAITLFIGSIHRHHNEVLLSQLPWSTLFFIIFLFGIAHGLEITGLTSLVADSIYNTVGADQIMIRMIIVLVGALVTAVMDNVIAIAVLAPIIQLLGERGVETNGLWFTLLAVAVVAGNLTPIGSAANIIANARVRAGWGDWWKTAGMLAVECLVLNVALLYLWEKIIS